MSSQDKNVSVADSFLLPFDRPTPKAINVRFGARISVNNCPRMSQCLENVVFGYLHVLKLLCSFSKVEQCSDQI